MWLGFRVQRPLLLPRCYLLRQALESSRNQCLAHNPPPLRDGISADSLVPRGPEPVMDPVFAANGPPNAQMELCGVGHIPPALSAAVHQGALTNKKKKASPARLLETSLGLDGARIDGANMQNQAYLKTKSRFCGPTVPWFKFFSFLFSCQTCRQLGNQGGGCITKWPLLQHSAAQCQGNEKGKERNTVEYSQQSTVSFCCKQTNVSHLLRTRRHSKY